MKTNPIRHTVFPILAAFIWGTAFVAQSMGADLVEPFTFNAARSIVAALTLALGLGVFRLVRPAEDTRTVAEKKSGRRELLLGGLCCGTALALGANLQQLGIETTTAGKASFITALYIVLVPICGLFFRKKVTPMIWGGVALAVVGLYYICVKEGFSITPGDFYVFLCAFCFAAQILCIDHFAQRVDGVALSCAQFVVASLWSLAGMVIFEQPSWSAILSCAWPILYVGVFSSGVGYTLQILAQKGGNPTVVSLLLSLEAVFGALAGALLLQERMSGQEYFGCALMLGAVVLAQVPMPKKKGLPSAAVAEE